MTTRTFSPATAPAREKFSSAEDQVKTIFKDAGILINGPNAWDVQVKDKRFYKKFTRLITLGLIESYVDEWIELADFDEFMYRLFRKRDYFRFKPGLPLVWEIIRHKYFNPNMSRKQHIVDVQYNLPPILFEKFLGDNLAYTCGYGVDRSTGQEFDFADLDWLEKAQNSKYSLLCDKANVKPGMTVLDIGCGWGGLARYLARERGCRVVAFTIASEQVEYARKLCQGLDVEVRLQSYEEPVYAYGSTSREGKFDAITCLGMFEHVGSKNHKLFMQRTHDLIQPGGKMALQTISFSHPVIITDPYIERVIFPDMTCSSPSQVTKAAEHKHRWSVLDQHELVDKNNRSFYYPTLKAWAKNMADNWLDIKPHITHMDPEKFYRLWWPYFDICAGAYRAGTYPRLIQYTLGYEHHPLEAAIR